MPAPSPRHMAYLPAAVAALHTKTPATTPAPAQAAMQTAAEGSPV